jgi:hypothetical protein
MATALTNGVVLDEDRSGWELACPSCGKAIRYTLLHITGGIEPFMYSDKGSDFMLRQEDADLVAAVAGIATPPTLEQLRGVYNTLETSVSSCLTDDKFTRWSYVKCPHCRYSLEYNGGVVSEHTRYFESTIVWIEGAVAYRGTAIPSNRLARVHVQKAYR